MAYILLLIFILEFSFVIKLFDTSVQIEYNIRQIYHGWIIIFHIAENVNSHQRGGWMRTHNAY